jgi:tRNA U38,U39,U40 pseudouridine synthase TruA
MLPDEVSEYFNIEFIANGFLRQQVFLIFKNFLTFYTQIRRMIALISLSACNINHGKKIAEVLLRYPDPLTFHQVGLRPAPPTGLFLYDVVYDPRMFLSPIPFYPNLWDSMIDQLDEDAKCENEEDNNQELEVYTDCERE